MASRKKIQTSATPTTVLYSLRARRERSIGEMAADLMTAAFGTSSFFVVNALLFVSWVIFNIVPSQYVFDPYPFGMLTMVVSLEAIFLSIIVLMSQNRASSIADLREEVDFQVNVKSERQNVQILQMLERIEKKLVIKDVHSDEYRDASEVLDLERLEAAVRESLGD